MRKVANRGNVNLHSSHNERTATNQPRALPSISSYKRAADRSALAESVIHYRAGPLSTRFGVIENRN
jgi:hypothetical protein